jgi:hypothetical protein
MNKCYRLGCMVDWSGREDYEKDLRSYFQCCPICGNNQMTLNLIPMGRDTITCASCDATWHTYIGLTGFKWAELDLPSKDGRGQELVGKRFSKYEIRKAAQASRINGMNVTSKVATVTKEREIIKERQVIVKIRCGYCRSTYDESLDKCPQCGAKS